MEKLGVENSQLIKELEEKYLSLKERQVHLVKTGSAQTETPELESVKKRLDELKRSNS